MESKKENYWKLLFWSLGAVTLFLFLYYQNKVWSLNTHPNSASEQVVDLAIEEDHYRLNFELEVQMTGLKAPDVECEDAPTDKKRLSELVQEKPLLIFRYADVHCSSCYEAQMKLLHEMFADKPDLLTVICSYQNAEALRIFRKINRKRHSIYHVPSDTFDWAAETCHSPYYFVLHPDMKISHVYVPSQEFPEYNKRYLEMIKRLLSN